MLDGYKTYIMAIIAFIIALCYTIQGYMNNGELHLDALATAFIALALLFLRQSLKTTPGA
jgi:hypothetical protein